MEKYNTTSEEIFKYPDNTGEIYTSLLQRLNNSGLDIITCTPLNYHMRKSTNESLHIGSDSVYILHKGRVALLKGPGLYKSYEEKMEMPQTVALRFAENSGTVLNPNFFLEEREGSHIYAEIFPIMNCDSSVSLISAIKKENAMQLLLSEEEEGLLFRQLLLRSQEAAWTSAEGQSEVRNANGKALLQLVAMYLYSYNFDPTIFITQYQLASFFGSDRSTIGQLLSTLYNEGIVSRERGFGEIKVLNPQRLLKIAEGVS